MAVHHDLSYRRVIPARGCIAHFQKAQEGGNTPMYDNRALWYYFMDLYYDLMLELSQEGILYIKTLPDENNLEKNFPLERSRYHHLATKLPQNVQITNSIIYRTKW